MADIVYCIRHGEPTVRNGQKLGLTENGKRQADTAAHLLKSMLDNTDTIILYSPVRRCEETAQIIGSYLEAPIQPAALRLKGADNLRISGAQSKLSSYLNNYKKLDIESPEDFARRIVEYVQSQPFQPLIIVGNEVPIKLLLNQVAKVDYRVPINHGSVAKLNITERSAEYFADKENI